MISEDVRKLAESIRAAWHCSQCRRNRQVEVAQLLADALRAEGEQVRSAERTELVSYLSEAAVSYGDITIGLSQGKEVKGFEKFLSAIAERVRWETLEEVRHNYYDDAEGSAPFETWLDEQMRALEAREGAKP